MEVCNNPDVLKVILFIIQILKILFTVVPIGLIVMIGLDLFKNITAGKEDEMKKNLSIAIKRIIYCIVIFFVPTIVSLVNTVVGEVLEDTKIDYTMCFTNANLEYIEKRIVEVAKEAVAKAKEKFTLSAAIEAETAISKISDSTIKEKLTKEIEELKTEIRIQEEANKNNDKKEEIVTIPNNIQGDGNSKGTLTSPIDPKDTNEKMLERMKDNSKTLYYKNGEYHGGSDVPVEIGTVIHAMDGGKVYSAKYAEGSGGANPSGYGNYIILEHDKGYYSVYAHLSAVNVKKGDKVSQGQKIGKSGNTGNSTGPHLHIELTTSDERFGKTADCVHILTLNYIGTGKKYTSAKGYCKSSGGNKNNQENQLN